MTKSIVTGGVMLVALAALVMGLTNVVELSSAGIVSWAAVGAVSTILFGAFGGFKPFFSSGLPNDDEGGGGGGGGGGGDDGDGDDGGSPLDALHGQSQSIARKLVTVGAEDEKDRPLFDDRAPIVSQPNVAAPPVFKPDDSPGSATGQQPNHPLFGQALREQLDSDRAGDKDHTGQDPNEPHGLEAGQVGDADEPISPAPLVGEAALWVAARNAQIDEETSSVPSIEVEESPAWMSTSVTEDLLEVEAEQPEAHLDADDASVDEDAGPGSASDEEDRSTDHAHEDHGLNSADVDHDDPANALETAAHDDHDDLSLDADEMPEDLTIEEAAESTVEEFDTPEDLDSIDADEQVLVAEEESVDPGEVDSPVDSGHELALATTQSDELPVVMKSPSALEIQKYSPTEILAVVRAQESELVDTLIGEGVLTTSGPITDKDVRTMLFVAVSSNELIDVLTEASDDSPKPRTSSRAALPKG